MDSFSFKTMSATLDAEEALEPHPFLVPPQAEEQGLINSKAKKLHEAAFSTAPVSVVWVSRDMGEGVGEIRTS